MKKYLAELQRRNVFRAIAAFVVFGWILLQAATALEDAMALPEWFDTIIVALLVLGLPAVVIVSWVYELTPDGLEKTSAVTPEQSITAATGRKLNYVTMAAVALLIVIIIGDRFIARDTPATVAEKSAGMAAAALPFPGYDDKSIAVLPFKNLSDDVENVYFSDGVMEAILNDLARLRDVKVVSRTSVESYRDTDKAIPVIGRELDVAHVLEGSVQRAGDRVRVTAQLIETKTDKHLWSSNYDRDIRDIFKIQSEIANAISRNLELILTSEEKELMANAPTSNLQAYDLFLRAHGNNGKRVDQTITEEVKEAISLCQQAVELDPEFALAYVCIGDALRRLGVTDYIAVSDWLQPALENLNKALNLDPKLWQAYAALAGINFSIGDRTKAFYYTDKVLELHPNHPGFLQIASIEKGLFAQYEAAVDLALRSLSLIPNGDYSEHGSIIFDNLVWLDPEFFLSFLGRQDRHIRDRMGYSFMRAGAALSRGDYEPYREQVLADYQNAATPNNAINLGLAYSFVGDFEKARSIYEQVISSSEGSENIFLKFPFMHRYANTLIKTGEPERGLSLLQSYRDQLLESTKTGESLHGNLGMYYDLALIYAILGDNAEAISWLKTAREKQRDGAFFDLAFVYGDTMLDPIRDEPEFKAMIQSIEDEQAEITRIFRKRLAEQQADGRLLWLTAD